MSSIRDLSKSAGAYNHARWPSFPQVFGENLEGAIIGFPPEARGNDRMKPV